MLLTRLFRKSINTLELAADTRPVHASLFKDLTPDGYEYYAGHYRGELRRCLLGYEVHVPNDPRVGFAPSIVVAAMDDLEEVIRSGVAGLDGANSLPSSRLPPEEKLRYTIVFACRVFEILLRIHPYANGNGHSARFAIWALLGRFGYWPRRWPIDPRPPDPPYEELIVHHRNGNPEPLEIYILSCIEP